MTTLTVTATQTAATFNGLLLRVKVLTGAALVQNGATVASATALNANISTTVTGSIVYGALTGDATAGAFNAEPLCTLIDNFHDTVNAEYYGSFRTTSPTGTPGSTLVGSTTANANRDMAAVEILPNGTITEDASAPAVATTTGAITVTTASFTPPGGSLLVAMVGTDGTAAGTGTTASVTDTGGGLTWTQVIFANSASTCYAGVWLAQVPGGLFVPGPPPQSGGSTRRRRYRRRQVPPLPPVPAPVIVPSFTAIAAEHTGRQVTRARGFTPVAYVPAVVTSVVVPAFTRAVQVRPRQPRQAGFTPVPSPRTVLAPWTTARRAAPRVPRPRPFAAVTLPKLVVFPVLAGRAPPRRAAQRRAAFTPPPVTRVPAVPVTAASRCAPRRRVAQGFARVPYIPVAAPPVPVVFPLVTARRKPAVTRPRVQYTGPVTPGAPAAPPPAWLGQQFRAARKPRTRVPPAQGFRTTLVVTAAAATPVTGQRVTALRTRPRVARGGFSQAPAPVRGIPSRVTAVRAQPRLARGRGFQQQVRPPVSTPVTPAFTQAAERTDSTHVLRPRGFTPAPLVVRVTAQFTRAVRSTRPRIIRQGTVRGPLTRGVVVPPPPWLGQRTAGARTHPRPPRRAMGFARNLTIIPPAFQLAHLTAGNPHSPWSAGEAHDSGYGTGEAHGSWAALGTVDNGVTAGTPHSRWSAGEAHD